MDMAGFMIFIVLFWAFFWPESVGRWIRDIEAGCRSAQ